MIKAAEYRVGGRAFGITEGEKKLSFWQKCKKFMKRLFKRE